MLSILSNTMKICLFKNQYNKIRHIMTHIHRLHSELFKWAFLPALLLLALSACRHPEVVEQEDLTFAHGLFILNEGNMGSNKASIDFYDPISDTLYRNIYPTVNPTVMKELGDVGNDIAIYGGKLYAVINVSGRAFMPEMDCPFQKIEDILAEIGDQADIVILDFHAETTSEKMAMGFYLDGRVQAVVGTHTHVQTADERLLPKGTAYITDLGMCGPWDSVLGVKPEIIIKKFTTCMPVRFELAEGPAVYSALLVEIDDASKKAVKVERILLHE